MNDPVQPKSSDTMASLMDTAEASYISFPLRVRPLSCILSTSALEMAFTIHIPSSALAGTAINNMNSAVITPPE